MRIALLLFFAACTGSTNTDQPCQSGQCTTPPAPTCDGDVAVRYSNIGECRGDTCNYAETREDCLASGSECNDGDCFFDDYWEEEEYGDCQDEECLYPPLDSCQDASTVVLRPEQGECNDTQTECVYEPTPQTCVEGCFDGSCNADPGVALPANACDTDAVCGSAGACVGDTCVCADGFRDCLGGCCAVTPQAFPFAGMSGSAAKLAYRPDGTANIALREPAPDLGPDLHAVRLYQHSVGEPTLQPRQGSMEVHRESAPFDMVYSRPDGLYIGVVSSINQARLFHYGRYGGFTRTLLGTANPRPGIALAVDDDQHVWTAWSGHYDGDEHAFRVGDSSAGTFVDTSSLRGATSLGLAANPANDTVHVFWQHATDGPQEWQHTFLTSVTSVSACDQGEVAFSRAGRAWSFVPATSSTDAQLCYNGVIHDVSDVITTPTLPNDLTDVAFTVSRDGTAFIAFYKPDTGAVHWASSRDGLRWAQGTSPVVYNTDLPGQVHLAMAARRVGGVGLFTVPSNPLMGDALLMEL